MKIDIVTLFPEMFENFLKTSIIGRAMKQKLVEIEVHNLRKWAVNDYGKVDDKPFGGGAGMVLMIEPIYKALCEIVGKEKSKRIMPHLPSPKLRQAGVPSLKIVALSAKGETYKQSKAKGLASKVDHLVLLCGHYEGFDQRILDNFVDEQISIGNYVLTGGEIPAMVVVDSVVRLIPNVLGNNESPVSDSFFEDDKTIQYPQYTRPEEFLLDNGETLFVPKVLLNGNHAEIKHWREEQKR